MVLTLDWRIFRILYDLLIKQGHINRMESLNWRTVLQPDLLASPDRMKTFHASMLSFDIACCFLPKKCQSWTRYDDICCSLYVLPYSEIFPDILPPWDMPRFSHFQCTMTIPRSCEMSPNCCAAEISGPSHSSSVPMTPLKAPVAYSVVTAWGVLGTGWLVGWSVGWWTDPKWCFHRKIYRNW